MPFINLNAITVTATYLMFDGTFATGTVSFSPPASLQAVIDSAGKQIIIPEIIKATLVSGHISVVLPASNDPDVAPNGWVYTVTENINGDSASPRIYEITLPYTLAGQTVDLSTIS